MLLLPFCTNQPYLWLLGWPFRILGALRSEPRVMVASGWPRLYFFALRCRPIWSTSSCSSGLIAPLNYFWIIIWSWCSCVILSDTSYNLLASHSTSSYDVLNYRTTASSCAAGGMSTNPIASRTVAVDNCPFWILVVSSGLTWGNYVLWGAWSSVRCLFCACSSCSAWGNLWALCFTLRILCDNRRRFLLLRLLLDECCWIRASNGRIHIVLFCTH